MNLKKYIDWLDSAIRCNSPMSKDSLEEIRDAFITIQEDWNDANETYNLFAKQTDLFTQ